MPGSVYAQAAPGALDMLNSLIVPTMLIIGIMYFLMIRPQQKRQKEQRTMMDALGKGDEVITSGGVLGTVTSVKDGYVTIEVASGSMVVQKSAITTLLPKGTVKAL